MHLHALLKTYTFLVSEITFTVIRASSLLGTLEFISLAVAQVRVGKVNASLNNFEANCDQQKPEA